ncbi:hypothetical protein Tmar_1977 [Thermaerobacter marianensis DSM 12885]|uniref:Uncharacterized protein n=1 Tax=Thermaerobacter marianensis (strain ATCC 700841 / DSM 12885 / JCM 10246 / 7p75a) TaxID=644966 RepID=E6SJ36_THEM7|nr:hypothetical protein Tmar_1977 [Thermaerobacter marianensis DSM 12885]
MRQRLKTVVRWTALLMFVVIAVLWQRRTGGAVAGLLAATAGLGAALFAAVTAFAWLMSGLHRQDPAPADARPAGTGDAARARGQRPATGTRPVGEGRGRRGTPARRAGRDV